MQSRHVLHLSSFVILAVGALAMALFLTLSYVSGDGANGDKKGSVITGDASPTPSIPQTLVRDPVATLESLDTGDGVEQFVAALASADVSHVLAAWQRQEVSCVRNGTNGWLNELLCSQNVPIGAADGDSYRVKAVAIPSRRLVSETEALRLLNDWLAGNPASLVVVAMHGESLQLGFKTAEPRGSAGADFEVQYFWVELEPGAENVLVQLQSVISPLAYMRYVGVNPDSILAISQDLIDLERRLEQEADDVMRTQLAQETATADASR